MKGKESLKEIALLFLKLGTIAFGGPAAHISMMEDEVVKKKKWISHEHFLDLVGATNLIPGPNSTEMTMHCGYERAGWRGLIIAGISFILPAVIITSIFGWLYYRYGQLSTVEPFLYGIKPAVVAIILSAVFSLGKKALKSIELGVLGGITLVGYMLGVNEIVALFGCGALGIMLYFFKKNRSMHSVVPFLFLRINALGENDLKIFWIFLKIGSVLYGSGYVLFAFLDAELVAKGLLSRQQLIDAIAIGQFTPGPVLSTAAFIGWQMSGFSGAILATIGIFLPSFLLVLLLNPLIAAMRKSEVLSAFLDAVNIASVALILAVSIEMGATVLVDWRTILIGSFSFIIVLIFKKLNSAFIVLGAVLIGYLLWLV